MKLTDPKGRVFTFGAVSYDLASRPFVMGILNVTPDSFSDGGRYASAREAVRHGIRLAGEGADFIDVGGESTRPGSDPVNVEEELGRVIPVIKDLSQAVTVPISIDTCKSEVAHEALLAGATVVNDVSGLTFDGRMPSVIADHKATAVVMHMKGKPKTMQENPHYDDLLGEVKAFLGRACETGKASGIRQIIIDPGIGFGKTLHHNLELIRRLRELTTLGYPILIGPSRKSFLGMILDSPPDERLEGTIAASVIGVMNGASIVRVHDVRAIVRTLKVLRAVENS